MKIKWKTLLTAIAIPLLVGGFAALLTRNNMDVFEMVNKPPLSPPAWLFPVAWTILYILMGIASYLVYNADGYIRSALSAYGLQLIVNFIWPLVFFNLRAYLFAFIVLLVLLALIILTTVRFHRLSKQAAYLLIPYIIWVTFAGYLNFGIYLLN